MARGCPSEHVGSHAPGKGLVACCAAGALPAVPAMTPGQPGEKVPPEPLANGNAGIVFP